ncbi:MAG: 3-deoxy-manno-octulosonate cytidylyltransferase [Lysobacteraceae bacterium]|nr:MAG: 3-deoxy-manno-octulosonate cytidylyltransferase [Xanthomonadaceae bacterium]
MTEFSIVIPARYASSRLPGKMLRDVAGKTLIERVIDQALACEVQDAVVATDDERILKVAQAAGVTAMMTSVDHSNGSERIEEVVRRLQWSDDRIVVNLQGDEALVPREHLEKVAQVCDCSGADVATLAVPIESPDEVFDPNAVKVVLAASGDALYFSRAPIPWNRQTFVDNSGVLGTGHVYLRHIGLYAMRVGALKRLVAAPVCSLEVTESLEQLRFLHAGARVQVAVIDEAAPPGVDTEQDLQRVIATIEAGQ